MKKLVFMFVAIAAKMRETTAGLRSSGFFVL